MAHIAIVGAGITGITTAYALLDCGHRVTLFERQRYAAMETSFANGGQLNESHGCLLLTAFPPRITEAAIGWQLSRAQNPGLRLDRRNLRSRWKFAPSDR